jgi:hypothetical protein
MNVTRRKSIILAAAAVAGAIGLAGCASDGKKAAADAPKYTKDSCCAKAVAAGKACEHPCCVESAKKGEVCKKCNPA